MTNLEKYHTLLSPAFQWGVSSSAYQIEGAVTQDGRGQSIWDIFSHTRGNTLNNETGDIACDHYYRYSQDVNLMKTLGVTHYRFSVSWPRILPQGRREAHVKGLAFYDRLVDTLLENRITPVVTLYHWDLPWALQEKGGWQNRDTADAFADYAALMVSFLGDRVKQWITHNEPWCTAYLGHLSGEHAPGIQEAQAAVDASHYVLVSHALATMAMRAMRTDLNIGITLNLSPVYPQDTSQESHKAARWQDIFNNRWFLDPLFIGQYPEELSEILGAQPPASAQDMEIIRQPLDFLGINYYSAQVVTAPSDGQVPWPVVHIKSTDRVSAMGWPVIPQGLTKLLVDLQNHYPNLPPVIITENGAAYNDIVEDGKVHDTDRILYLSDHIDALANALAQGVNVQGYYLWSLMDNFEWAWGYSKRFGIVYVDYRTQERILKDSFLWYRQLIQSVLSPKTPD